jgi:hypothetical protein
MIYFKLGHTGKVARHLSCLNAIKRCSVQKKVRKLL